MKQSPRQRKRLMVVGGIVLTGVLLVWLMVRLVDWGLCSYYGYQTERETRYAAFMGCMVQVKEGWVPRNEIRVLQ